MSTYSDASLILPVAPERKAGKIYSLKPTGSTGDFSYSRSTTKYETNSDGSITQIAINMPSFNLSGSCPTLLLEPQTINLITYPDDLTNASWQKSSAGSGSAPIVTSNVGVSPDGTTTADRVQFDCVGGASGDESFIRNTGLAASGECNFSYFIKSYDGAEYTLSPIVNGATQSAITVTSEWQRLDVTDTFASTNWGFETRGTFTGQTADVLIWKCQFAEQSYMTSPVGVNGGVTTREKDICYDGGDVNSINSPEGCLFIDIKALYNDGTYRTASINDGTTNNRVEFYYRPTDNQITFIVMIGGASIISHTETLTDATIFNKLIIKWKAGEYGIFVNGVKVNSSNSLSVFLADTLTSYSFRNSASGENMIAEINDTMIYATALTDAECVTKTT